MNRRDNQKGFAMIEFILVIAIFAGVMVVIANFSQNSTILSSLINQSLQVEQNLQQAFQVLVTEIRSMGPSSLGAYPIASVSSSSLVFYSDIDEDGFFERVRYSIGTSTLVKGVVKPAGNPLVYASSTETVSVVVQNLVASSSSFEYFNVSYTGTQNPLSAPIDLSAVRIVRATITADVSPTSAPKPVTFTNTVTIRNLRDE